MHLRPPKCLCWLLRMLSLRRQMVFGEQRNDHDGPMWKSLPKKKWCGAPARTESTIWWGGFSITTTNSPKIAMFRAFHARLRIRFECQQRCSSDEKVQRQLKSAAPKIHHSKTAPPPKKNCHEKWTPCFKGNGKAGLYPQAASDLASTSLDERFERLGGELPSVFVQSFSDCSSHVGGPL